MSIWKVVVVLAVIALVVFVIVGGLEWLHLARVLGELD